MRIRKGWCWTNKQEEKREIVSNSQSETTLSNWQLVRSKWEEGMIKLETDID